MLALTIHAHSQELKDADLQIRTVIDGFFKSLSTKDTLMMLEYTMKEAQIWRLYKDEYPVKFDHRYTKDDLPQMSDWPELKETALDFKIIHYNGIATAWVPYEFWIEDQFSHCGIDAFTLFEIDGKWKIITAAYTIQKENCDHLRLPSYR